MVDPFWGAEHGAATPAASSPTMSQRRLAQALRRLREDSGRTMSETAAHLGCASSKISRIENAVSHVHWRDVRDLVCFYEGSAAQLDELVALAHGARQRGWWQSYGAVLREKYMVYIGLEAEAVGACVFGMSVIPGLLQTGDYAREAMVATLVEPESAEDLVTVLTTRQEVLSRHDAPLRLHAVVDEAALRRPFGPASVMRRQLSHLLDVASLPNVTVQVLPFAVGGHPATTGPFAVLGLPAGHPPLVYLEHLHDDLCLEDPADVDRFRTIFERLAEMALGPSESAEFVDRLIDDGP